MSFDITKSLLEAPCRWCGYNGEGYWQKDTHDKHCIWHDVGGADKREAELSKFGRIKQPENSIPISKLEELIVKLKNEQHQLFMSNVGWTHLDSTIEGLQKLIDEAKQ